MDELKLLAELRHQTPPITTAAAQSARARLLAAAAGSPASRGRRSRMPSGRTHRGWRVAAATALALVLTVGVTVTRDVGVNPDHPAQGRSPAVLPVGVANAAELGQRAAKVVAGQPDLHPRPHQWTYIEVCWATPRHGTGSYGLCPGRETRRYWTRIDAKRFAVEQRGRLYQYPNYQRSPVYPWPTFAYLRRLPTDPQALLTRLYATFSSPGGDPPYGKHRFSREEQHRMVFHLAMKLLWSYVLPPGVQAAIYQALPRISGVQLQPDAVDAVGRHGVAFARTSDARVREEIILDPQTYQYLGWRRIAITDFVEHGFIAGRKDPQIAKGTVLESQARTAAAIVDRPGHRP